MRGYAYPPDRSNARGAERGGLLLFGTPLGHWGPGFRLDTLPGEAPGEGARKTSSGKPLGQSLHLGAGVTATQA